MQDIADECGVTKPTIYYHYSSKRGLFQALCRQVTGRLAGILGEELDSGSSVSESLVRIARRVLEVHTEDTGFASLHLAFHKDPGLRSLVPDVQDEFARLDGLMTRLMEKGVAAGELRRDIPIQILCRIYSSVLHTALSGLLDNAPGDMVPSPEEMVRILMNGIES
jgi:AcrR family transcriptional regulator